MERIFAEGFMLQLDADACSPSRLLRSLPERIGAVYLRGRPERCLAVLRALRLAHPTTAAGMRVYSLQQGVAAAQAGAAFVCPPVVPGGDLAPWSLIAARVIPLCPDSPAALSPLLEGGFDTFLLASADRQEALRRLQALYAACPAAGFLCAGPYEEPDIAALTPFCSVRAVTTRPILSREDGIALAAQGQRAVLGFELAHVGINSQSEAEAAALAATFGRLFGWDTWDNGNSFYASARVECMKFPQRGRFGHLAILTNSASRAKDYLRQRGLTPVESTAKYRDGRLHNIYFEEEPGGFSLHLLQKNPELPAP